MTDSTTTAEAEATPKKRKGRSGKAGPAVVLNGSNVEEYFPPPPKKMGAPSTYTPEMADRICKWVAEGKTLYSFCLIEGTPNYFTVADWRRAHPDFDQKYARAKDDGWDVFAEKLVERSVDVPPELAQSRRLEVDTGKWLLSKLAARRYGDRIEVKSEISGSVQIDLQAVLLKPEVLTRLDDAQIEALRSAISLLAAPATPGMPSAAGPVIDGTCSPVEAAEDAGDD